MAYSRRSILLAVVAVLVAAMVTGFLWRVIRGPQIDAVRLKRANVVQMVVASGSIEPQLRPKLGAQVSGVVMTVLIGEGDSVKMGQALVRLEDTEAQASLAQAQAASEQSLAKLQQLQGVSARVAVEALRQTDLKVATARRDLRREEILAQQNASTKENFEQATMNLRLAESQATAAAIQARAASPKGADSRIAIAAAGQAQAMVAAAAARLADYTLTAPMDGTALKVPVAPGDAVRPGDLLIEMAASGSPRVTVQVDEKNLPLIQVGQTASVLADSYPGRPFAATVTWLAPAIDPARGTVEVRLAVKDPPSFLRFDMSVSVAITTAAANASLTLPHAAVQEPDGKEPYVFVANGGKASRRVVRLGLRGDSLFEITSGVLESDEVLIPQDGGLRDGQAVRAVRQG